MRLIIAGTRTIHPDFGVLDQETRSIEAALGKHITVVLCGGARGADAAGKRWAEARGIKVEMWNADWERFGMRAGHMRNEQMANHADALLLLWDGESRGSKSMLRYATKKGLRVRQVVM